MISTLQSETRHFAKTHIIASPSKTFKQTLVSGQAHGVSSLRQSVAVSFEMPTLTLLPLEEVLPGSSVLGVGDTHLAKSLYRLAQTCDLPKCVSTAGQSI